MPPQKISTKSRPGPRTAPKKIQQIVLKQEHSLDLVHTAIASIMLEVIFARKVFPTWTKWSPRFYDPTNLQTTYESFVSGAQEPKQGRGRIWHVPVRDQMVALDKLMDHFEGGIKDALEKKYLSNITMSFHIAGTNPLGPATCLESYKLKVSYGSNGMPYISAEMSDSQRSETTDMTLGEGKTRLQSMVNGISDLFSRQSEVFKANKTKPLPENTRVDVKLQYTEETPPDYQPRNFQRYSESAWDNDKETGARENLKHKFEINVSV